MKFRVNTSTMTKILQLLGICCLSKCFFVNYSYNVNLRLYSLIGYFFRVDRMPTSLDECIYFSGNPSLCFVIAMLLIYCYSFYFPPLANKLAWLGLLM